MTFAFRVSGMADLAAVDALLARSYPRLLKDVYPPSVLVTALPVISRAQPDLLSCGTYYVADEAGAIVGAGGWTPDRTDPTRGHIRHVVTDYRQLRRGIARGLLERCFETARAAGVTHMECWATMNAEPFYHAVGFETVGPMVVTLAGGISFPSIRMEQVL